MTRSSFHKRAARATAVFSIAVLVAVAGIWLTPRVSESAAVWLRTPPVRSQTLRVQGLMPVVSPAARATTARLRAGVPSDASTAADAAASGGAAGEALSLDPGLRFTMVGLQCRPPANETAVTIRVRTSEDGATWTDWYSTSLEYAAEVGGGSRAYTEPLWMGGSRYLQISAESAAGVGTAPSALSDVRVTAISTGEDADHLAQALGVVRRVAATVASLELTPPSGAMTNAPAIVARAQWGADEAWRSGSPSVAPVKMAFIHHTASGNSYSRSQAPAIMRGIYYYHTHSLGWSDIGYNFLVDRYGTIYEGRYGGVTKGVIGAQTLGFNTSSTGISVIGNFTTATPPSAVVSALVRLLAWKLDVHHVNPESKARIVCNFGQRYVTGQVVEFPAIVGHRAANYTGCPGVKLNALLPSIRKAAAARGLPKIYTATDDLFISPNADGSKDKTTIRLTISAAADWRVDIRDANGATVRQFSGRGSTAAVEWGGNSADGAILPDGAYTVVVGASTESGVARKATVTVWLDTVQPKLASSGVAPNPFSPNGDGQRDVATVSFTPDEACSSRVSVLGDNGEILRRLSTWSSPSADRSTVRWDGQVVSGSALAPAPEGPHVIEIALRDRAGNAATFTRAVNLDRTLGFPAATPGTFSPNGDGVQDTVTVGFNLIRRATVWVEALEGATLLHTLAPGELGAGTRALRWDGRMADQTALPSGFYRFRVRAQGAMGTSVVSVPFTVDRYRPRLSAPERFSVTYGRTARIAYSVRDPYSSKVKVWAVVKNARGATVATVACGWVTQGKTLTYMWKPPARRTYTVTLRAADRGGNRESTARLTILKVL